MALVLFGRRPSQRAARRPTPRTSFGEGLRYTFGVPEIRACLLIASISGVLFNTSIFLPAFAKTSLHLGPDGFAALAAAFGVGGLIGATVAARQPRPTVGRAIAVAAATGVAMACTAVAPTPILADLGMVACGVTSIWFTSAGATLLQLITIPAQHGRVMGLWSMAIGGFTPINGLLIGFIADHATPRWAIATASLLWLLTATASHRTTRSPNRLPTPTPVGQ